MYSPERPGDTLLLVKKGKHQNTIGHVKTTASVLNMRTRLYQRLCVLYMHALCVCSVDKCIQLCNPMDCSPPGSSVHEILQARILEWVAISPSRGPSRPRDPTCVSFVSYRQVLYCRGAGEAFTYMCIPTHPEHKPSTFRVVVCGGESGSHGSNEENV